MAKIVDPDQLNQATEVVITTATKTIQLLVAGNLSDAAPGQTSGVTLQAVYSFLKEEWKTDVALNKFKFPLLAIYEAKFQLQNGWDWEDDQTRDLIRDAGWQETNGDEYATIISLGAVDDDNADQPYYSHVSGFDQTTIAFDKTGRLNEPIMINDEGASDWRDYLKVLLREQGKTFDEYNLLVGQDLSALTYIAYRLPLTNKSDDNIDYTDNDIETTQPFTSMALQYYRGTLFETWSSGTTYVIDDVALASDGHWYRCTAGHSNQEPPNGSYWELYPGERLIGSDYRAFNRAVVCDSGNKADDKEIYAFCQYKNRQVTDINDDTEAEGYGTVYGNVGIRLCNYVGTTLHSWPGVCFDNFDPNITNSIVLHDITADGDLDAEDVPVVSTERTYPFVSAGNMVFNAALVNDASAEYWMYFKDANGNQYDTSNAIIVQDNSSTDIKGSITQATISFDFDYDNNVQGGRTPGTDAIVMVVAMGLDGAEWIVGEFTITEATGLNFPVNAPTERNYSNPS